MLWLDCGISGCGSWGVAVVGEVGRIVVAVCAVVGGGVVEGVAEVFRGLVVGVWL